jgi:cytidyltransferase-like protein
MNQLLGLFKYGRGNVPPLQKLDEEEIDIVNDFPSGGRRIALVPGAFKPPHRGHLEMVQHYAEMADQVVIMISPLSRKTPSGKAIGFEASKAIWEIYLRDVGLQDKVSVICSPVNSPVLATYQFVENKSDSPEFAQPGDIVLPGCSTKGGDQSRFKADFEKYAREGVIIADPLSCAFVPSGDALSASDFRRALDTGDGLEVYIPPNTDPGEVYSVLGAGPQSLSEVLTKLVEEVIDEMSSMATGNVAVGMGAEEEGLIREEEPEEEDDIITEVFDYLVKKGVLS